MSTRATYQFTPKDKWSPTITLYIHHDGYQEGAAEYARMVAEYIGPNKSHKAVERWLRALPEHAEITRAHEAHADTEYRYTFTDNGTNVKVQAGSNWNTLYEGPTADWINKQLNLSDTDRCVTFQGEVELVSTVLSKMKDEIARTKHSMEKGWTSSASALIHLTQLASKIPEAEALLTSAVFS